MPRIQFTRSIARVAMAIATYLSRRVGMNCGLAGVGLLVCWAMASSSVFAGPDMPEDPLSDVNQQTRLRESLQDAERELSAVRASGDRRNIEHALLLLVRGYSDLDELSLAESYAAELAAGQSEHFGPTHDKAVNARAALARVEALKRLSPEDRLRVRLARAKLMAARSLFSQGKYEVASGRAEEIQKILIETIGRDQDDYVGAVLFAADCARALQDYPRAEALFREALVAEAAVSGTQHNYYRQRLLNLADALREANRLQESIDYYREAWTAIEASDIADEKRIAPQASERIGDCYAGLSQLRPAIDAYAKAMQEYARSGNRVAAVRLALERLGPLSEQAGSWDRAEGFYKAAYEFVSYGVDAADRQRAALSKATMDYRSQLRWFQSERAAYDRYLNALVQRGDKAEAWRVVLSWTGRVFMRQRASRLAAENPEIAPLFAKLQVLTSQSSTLMLYDNPARGGTYINGTREEIRELDGEIATMEREILGLLDPEILLEECTPEELKSALPEGTAMVAYQEYMRSPRADDASQAKDSVRALLAFIVRPGRDVEMVALGESAPITEAIDAWRTGYGLTSESQQAGALLRSALWTPLEHAIGEARVVLVSPDGPLGKLPFAALPGSAPDTYLLEDVTLALVPVPQLIGELVNGQARKAPARDLLLVGGVVYDRQPGASDEVGARRRPWERSIDDALVSRTFAQGMSWIFLRGSESEAAFIKDLYVTLMDLPAGSKRVEFLRGTQATEGQIRALAPNFAMLHIATHGFFSTEDRTWSLADDTLATSRNNLFGDRLEAIRVYNPGLLSGLVMSGANVPPELPKRANGKEPIPDDGILTSEEIASLPLNGVQLVVLSACETGLGEVAGGEGLLGVQRAFQVAGARTTIATLWKVSDEATRRIMEEFYRNFLELEMSPLESLRAAQLWAINNPDLVPRGADAPTDEAGLTRLPPQFWAAFTLSGDWR